MYKEKNNMKKKMITILFSFFMITLTGCSNHNNPSITSTELQVNSQEQTPIEGQPVEQDEMQPLLSFSFNLFKENINGKNPVLSPLSAYLALHMLAEGSDHHTKEELEFVLGSLEYQNRITAFAKNTLISNSDDLIFSISDSAWIDDDLQVNEEWLKNVLTDRHEQAFQMDLSTDQAMQQINNWVKDSTHDMIARMIENPLPTETRLVLFNALYMKGKWQNPFEHNNTFEEIFHINTNDFTTVSMMNQYEESYSYFENDLLEGTILPYQNSSLAFVACKTKEQNGNIRELIGNMSEEDLIALLQSSNTRLLNLKLPTFEISCERTLNDSLKKLGINDAFDPERADLSKIGETSAQNPLFVSLVYQKAKVNVNEEGTEAAAVTEILCVESAAYCDPVDVYNLYFNQPFFYMIFDTEHQIPVFLGIVDAP